MSKGKPGKRWFWKVVWGVVLIGIPLGYGGYRAILNMQCRQIEQQVRDAGLMLTFDELVAHYKKEGEENAADYYTQAVVLFDHWKKDHKDSKFPGTFFTFGRDEEIDNLILRSLVENQEVIEWLFKAAGANYCYFQLKDPSDNYDYKSFDRDQIRDCAGMLSNNALLAGWNDDKQEMLHSLDAIFAMGKHISHQPSFINYLAGMGFNRLGLDTIEKLINHCSLTADSLESILRRLETVYDADILHQTIASDIVSVHNIISSDSLGTDWEYKIFELLGGMQLYYRDNLQIILEFQEAARSPLDQRFNARRITLANCPQGDSLVYWVLESINGTWLTGKEVIGLLFFTDFGLLIRRNLAQGALAVECYRHEHGELPEKLSELVPKYLDEVPLDYFAPYEVEIQYEVTNEGYKLYSVSLDGDVEGPFWRSNDTLFEVEIKR